MKKFLAPIFLTLFSFLLLILHGCGGTPPQVSGIVAKTEFVTTACIPLEKTMQIRNNNMDETQRVQGVLFELGTNEDRYFKIEEVTANGSTKTVVANLQEEILLPPGGSMSVKVAYNPKKVTVGDERHKTYLDIFLNGPKLGTMQIELDGKAETAAPGCGEEGSFREFDVTGVTTTLSHKDLGANVVKDLDPSSIEGTFKLSTNESKVSLKTTGWPTITFPLPAGSPIPEMKIILLEDSSEVDFGSDGKLTLKDLTFQGGGVVTLSGLELTTDTISIDSSKAPNVGGGSISFTGSPLNDKGEMTLVVAAPLTDPTVASVEKVGGGVFGMDIHLKEKK